MADGGFKKILLKLQSLKENRNFYETYKLYKVLYSRYMNLKKYDELKEILYDGSTFLLNANQEIIGTDLANLYVTILLESNTQPTEDLFIKLANLFDKMDDTLESRDFLDKTMKWSRTNAEYPRLHKHLAQIYWRKGDIVKARHHYLHSTDGCGYAMMLIELHITKGYTVEIDLFIAQVVLQYLCLKNKNSAKDAFVYYTNKHPNIIGPPYMLPLLNFICFLLSIVDSGKLTTFMLLCEKYETCLKRDPLYLEYLDEIGQIFFNVKSKNIG